MFTCRASLFFGALTVYPPKSHWVKKVQVDRGLVLVQAKIGSDENPPFHQFRTGNPKDFQSYVSLLHGMHIDKVPPPGR